MQCNDRACPKAQRTDADLAEMGRGVADSTALGAILHGAAVLPVGVQHVECFDLAMPGERPVIVDDGCTVVVGRTHLV